MTEGRDETGRVLAERDGDTIYVDLWYPGCDPEAKYISIGLMHVRAADAIRISYDFERDGYLIEQQELFSHPDGTVVAEGRWMEVAFIKAWQLERTVTELGEA